MGVLVLVASVAACTSSPDQAAPPSTFGAGSPWQGSFTSVALPAPVNSLTALECVNALRCWAVGSTVGVGGAPNGAAIITTADGGVRWSTQVIPPTVGYLSAIACSDPRHCTAVGQAGQTSDGQSVVIATSDAGGSWTQAQTPPGTLDVTAVSCQPDRRCLAIGSTAAGGVALVSTSAGSTWTMQGALPPNITGANDISCSNAQTCWVTAQTVLNPDHVSGAIAVTTDGGSSWATEAIPNGVGILNGVSCLVGSPTGAGALPTTSTVPTTAPPSATPTAAPPSATPTAAPPSATPTTAAFGVAGINCTVVGTTATSFDAGRSGQGVILTTGNGGATWTNQTVPTAASLMDVSCTGIGSCVGVGSSVSSSSEAGLAVLSGSPQHPWQRPAMVGAPQPLTAVSCQSSSQCVVVGESILEYLAG